MTRSLGPPQDTEQEAIVFGTRGTSVSTTTAIEDLHHSSSPRIMVRRRIAGQPRLSANVGGVLYAL